MCWFRIGAIPIITIIAQSIVPAFSPASYLCTGGHVVLLPKHRHSQSANDGGEISLLSAVQDGSHQEGTVLAVPHELLD